MQVIYLDKYMKSYILYHLKQTQPVWCTWNILINAKYNTTCKEVKSHVTGTWFLQLGVLGYTQSRVDEALAYYLQDLKLTRSEVGVTHPRVARILGSIGMVYDDKNDKMAGELYESSLAMLLDTYGSAHVDVATAR